MAAASRPSPMPSSRPAPACGPPLSSAATRPAIASRPKVSARCRPDAEKGRVSRMSELLRPQPRPGVLDIAAYVPGKSEAPGVARVFKLSSNETPLGPSPRAREAYREAAEHLEDYPDGVSLDESLNTR